MEDIIDKVPDITEDIITSEPIAKLNLNLDTSTWEGWFNSFLLYAAQNPLDFLYYMLLFLSPFFLLSIFLSMKLAKALEAQEKESKRKAKRDSNISKVKRTKGD